jgi:hypothetical protein
MGKIKHTIWKNSKTTIQEPLAKPLSFPKIRINLTLPPPPQAVKQLLSQLFSNKMSVCLSCLYPYMLDVRKTVTLNFLVM